VKFSNLTGAFAFWARKNPKYDQFIDIIETIVL
jgi:hypothetical protein